MADIFRIIDTGVREGRRNIAFDAALIEARHTERVPDTIRFLRFPPTVLIGRHQDLGREVNLEYCRDHAIGTVRRITGGGAIYLDEGQLGWELVFHRAALGVAALPDLTREICSAAALGLSSLGIEARFRPRNDIEVGGRKISGTGGFFDGDIRIFQGTVLVDLDAGQMARALRVPASKLTKRRIDSAAERVVTLKELLGEATPALATLQQRLVEGFSAGLGIRAAPGSITEHEEALARRFYEEEIGRDEFVAEIDDAASSAEVLAGTHTGAGGTIDSYLKLDGPVRGILQRVLISGDFFVTPPRVVFDLEAHLQGRRLDEIDAAVDEFFATSAIDMLSVTAEDFKASIANALDGIDGRGGRCA